MTPCVRCRIYVRRRRRWLRRFVRDVRDDIQYRHAWEKKRTPSDVVFYRCARCKGESVSPVGGHQDRCPGRVSRNVKTSV